MKQSLENLNNLVQSNVQDLAEIRKVIRQLDNDLRNHAVEWLSDELSGVMDNVKQICLKVGDAKKIDGLKGFIEAWVGKALFEIAQDKFSSIQLSNMVWGLGWLAKCGFDDMGKIGSFKNFMQAWFDKIIVSVTQDKFTSTELADMMWGLDWLARGLQDIQNIGSFEKFMEAWFDKAGVKILEENFTGAELADMMSALGWLAAQGGVDNIASVLSFEGFIKAWSDKIAVPVTEDKFTSAELADMLKALGGLTKGGIGDIEKIVGFEKFSQTWLDKMGTEEFLSYFDPDMIKQEEDNSGLDVIKEEGLIPDKGNFGGNGDKCAISSNKNYSNFWDKYYNSNICELLQLRLDDIQSQAKILNVGIRYMYGTERLLATKIGEYLSKNTSESKILMPLNIGYKEHWVGIYLQMFEDRGLSAIYLDPQNQSIPESLKKHLTSILAERGYAVKFAQMPVEQQKYGNCGPEVVENFVKYLTGGRATQEEAVKLHSKLFQASLLKGPASHQTSQTDMKTAFVWSNFTFLDPKLIAQARYFGLTGEMFDTLHAALNQGVVTIGYADVGQAQDVITPNSETLLNAICNNDVSLASEILANNTNADILNIRLGGNGIVIDTLLHQAIRYGASFEMMTLLFQNGADLNRYDSNGQTPLDLLALRRHQDQNKITQESQNITNKNIPNNSTKAVSEDGLETNHSNDYVIWQFCSLLPTYLQPLCSSIATYLQPFSEHLFKVDLV